MKTKIDTIREALNVSRTVHKAMCREDYVDMIDEALDALSDLEAHQQTEDLEAPPVSDRKLVDHVDVETIALDLTEGIWLRVKGISQHEMLSLVKRSIHAGMGLRSKPEPTKE